jgi:hypothetical protein
VFLLCSDGLTGVVTPDEVGAVAVSLPPDEAAKLLVHMANLRGGPDNITVLIVRVAGGSSDPDGSRRGAGAFGKLVKAWNRRVPLPYTALGAGSLLACLAVGLHLAEWGAFAGVLFVLAATVILGGVAGLVMQLVKPPQSEDEAPPPDEGPRELHVYKTTACPVTPEVADKFAELEASLAQAMRVQEVPADWAAHDKLAKAADAAKAKPPADAFRARCKSLLFLAEAFHKARNKEESFRPNFTSPTRA